MELNQSVTSRFQEQISTSLKKRHPKWHPKYAHFNSYTPIGEMVMIGLKIDKCLGGHVYNWQEIELL